MSSLTKTGKAFIALVWLCIASITAGANTPDDQNGTIKGVVTTADNKPADGVVVSIKSINKNTVSNDNGTYTLKNIPAGTYTVSISLVGYEPVQKEVTIAAAQTVVLDFQLKLSEQQLQDVQVTSARNRFAKQSSEYVARMPLRNLENPQSYVSISSQLLKEQVVTNFDDALKNASGIDKLWTSTGRAGDGAAYFSLRGFSVQPTMINGIAGVSNGGLDPANVESIDVIKGPSGTLFGSSLVSFGGLININTKKPYDTLGGEVTYTAGSFGLTRITADVNTPLNKAGNVALRVNGAYHYENSFQDAGFKRSTFLAPSLSYKASDKLSFLINTEIYNATGTNPLMLFLNRSRKLVYTTPEQLNVGYKRSFTANDVTISTPTFSVYGKAEYKFAKGWVSQTVAARSVRKSDGYYQYVMFTNPGDTVLNRLVSDQYSNSTTTDIQQNFIGDFKIGNVRNRVVAGLDVLQVTTDNSNTPYITFDQVNTKTKTLTALTYGNISQAALDAKFAASTAAPTKAKTNQYTYSAYISDVVNITDNLIAMASVRIDRFDNKGTYNILRDTTTGNYAQTTVSPKFGVVYQVLPNRVSVFANYMNGFSNVAPYAQPDGSIETFKPQQANQWEGGLKLQMPDGKLAATISYYDILVKNVVRADPFKVNYRVQDGNIYSRGFEAEVIASPVSGLNIIAGYSYNNSKNDKTDSTTNGLRPVSAGPKNLAHLWISYSPVQGPLKGFGIGFGGNYASENIISNTTIVGQFTLPSYTILNATLFYNVNAFRFAVKVDNLTDKQYWKGWTTVEPQKTRSINASVAFRF